MNDSPGNSVGTAIAVVGFLVVLAMFLGIAAGLALQGFEWVQGEVL